MSSPQKTIIITGATSGLGYECALQLARTHQWHILIISSNRRRVLKALDELQLESANLAITGIILDLSDLDAIHQFAKRFSRLDLPPLHAIICNASRLESLPTLRSHQGFETMFASNYLGHFLLVNLLLNYLQNPAKIIFLGCDYHRENSLYGQLFGFPPPHYTNATQLAYPPESSPKNPVQTYATSKFCTYLFAYELARRLHLARLNTPDYPIEIKLFDPGILLNSGLHRDLPTTRWFVTRVLQHLMRPFFFKIKPVRTAAYELIQQLEAPAHYTETALHIEGTQITRSDPKTYDLALAKDLWETSLQLSKLDASQSLLPLGNEQKV